MVYPSVSFPQISPPKPSMYTLLSPIRATCPVHFILLDVITRIIFGESYRSLSSSLCSFLHSSITLSLLGPIFSTPYSRTPSAYVPLSMWATTLHTHTKQHEKLWFLIFWPLYFLGSKLEDKRFRTVRYEVFEEISLLLWNVSVIAFMQVVCWTRGSYWSITLLAILCKALRVCMALKVFEQGSCVFVLKQIWLWDRRIFQPVGRLDYSCSQYGLFPSSGEL